MSSDSEDCTALGKLFHIIVPCIICASRHEINNTVAGQCRVAHLKFSDVGDSNEVK